MKILFVVPPSMNLETVTRSIPKSFGHEVHVSFIDKRAIEVPDHWDAKWDLLVYSGAVDGVHAFDIQELKALRKHSKTVYISCHGGSPDWHPLINDYISYDVFDLMVNIDGSFDWPHRKQDLTLIGCVDPTPYEEPLKKTIDVGVNFASHPARDTFLEELRKRIPVVMGPRHEEYGNHKPYSDFMKSCKVFVNVNWTDINAPVTQLNMKAIEAAYAKTAFFEKRDGALNQWFNPKFDYFEYSGVDDLAKSLELWICNDFIRTEKVARMLSKTTVCYSNEQFWKTVLDDCNF